MNTASEKIAALRAAMQQNGVDGYLVPSADPHMSEYLPDHYQTRSWLSGFDGSAGTLAVTAQHAALWTDGRYFIQAQRQLEGSGIVLMRMAQKETPSVEDWLAKNLPAQGVMGVDGMVTATATVQKLEKAFADQKITLKDVDLIPSLWQNRPAMPCTEAWLLDAAYAGKTAQQKLQILRAALAEKHADSTLVSRLDSVAWLLNLRAEDIDYNPFAMAYCIVTANSATLFINEARLPAEAAQMLATQGVVIAPYDAVAAALAKIDTPSAFVYEPAGLSYTLHRALAANANVTLAESDDPVQLLKSIKDETEIKNIKNAHLKDGVAMVCFAMELQEKMAAGVTITECDVSDMMLRLRTAQADCIGASFGTIAAYGANAAMMHYHPTPENCAVLPAQGLLLVDCGGQYRDGTTDITRTYALGTLTNEEKEFYTLVLKSHIGMASAVFLEGCTGGNLDILARSAVWKRGLDYRCGTGHGVGFVGGVHEGPQSLRINNTVAFAAGMTITDEPGIYEEGRVGVRIENELLCKEWGTTDYGRFLCFEAITYCPIDTAPILVEMLTDDELCWLNTYHAMVKEALSPRLNDAQRTWLAGACAPLAR